MKWLLYVLAVLGGWALVSCVVGPLIGRCIDRHADETGLTYAGKRPVVHVDPRFAAELHHRIIDRDRIHWDALDDWHHDSNVLYGGGQPDTDTYPSRRRGRCSGRNAR